MICRRKAFRWLAALGVPVLVLLGLELALRLAGWGYPTHFFLRAESGPPGLFTENPRFGWRFFPRRLARAPDPIRLSKIKPAGTCRIFVFGESAALGDPVPAYSFSRILKELLEERCPGTAFEVVNAAMTAINSHAILRIALDCVPFQGDIWIVYVGNNEVIGPFGPGSVFGAKSPPLSFITASLALKGTRLGQALDALFQHRHLRKPQFTKWEGMKMMLQERFRATDPLLQPVYAHFARNLTELISLATRAGVKPIVCSISSNLKDCPPFASLHRSDLTGPQKAEWEQSFAAGIEQESRTNLVQALAQYRRAAAVDGTYAELLFRLARVHLSLGDVSAASTQFTAARDADVLRFRADSRMNAIIQAVCARRAAEGVRFFDSGTVLTNVCRGGIPGEECFWDHVHFSFRGNYLVARALADQVISLLPATVRRPAGADGRDLTEAQCAERLAYTEWDQRRLLEEMRHRVQEPPFTGQLDHDGLLRQWDGLLAELQRRTERDGLVRAVQLYRQALLRHDDDWILHHRFAFVLEALGDLAGAEQQWQRVVELVPGYTDAWFKLGDVRALRSKLAEAKADYRQVLRLRPNSFEAINGLGLVALSENQLAEAARLFVQALEIEPQFLEAHVNLGLVSVRQGNLAQAEAHYRAALRLNPESAGAHINLGNLLATRQQYEEAINHFHKAATLRPKEATVHLALANALAAVGRSSEAVTQYRMALELNPALPEAQFNLGLALAKQGDLAAATTCFEAAVRLNPQDPQACLNLGVALAKQNRLREAIIQFQAVLRLDPGNAAAQQYLQTATAREAQKPER